MDNIISSLDTKGQNFEEWRHKLARNLLRALCVLGVPVTAFSIYLAIEQDVAWQIPIRVGVYVLLLLITFWPNMPYHVQTWGMISIFYIFGTFNLTQYAITAESFLFLITATTLASLFFGRKIGQTMMLIVCLTLLALAFAFTSEYIVVYYPHSSTVRNPDWSSWIFIVFLFGALGTGLQYAQGYVLAHLAVALEESHRLTHDLNAERTGLAQLVKQRTASAEQAREEAVEAANALQAQVWSVTGMARLNTVMRGEQDVAQLAQAIIIEISKYIEADVGALYVRDDNNTLNLQGRYAYTIAADHPTHFAMGEGLVGQAAQDGQIHALADLQETQLILASGLGEHTLHHLLLAPFAYVGDVIGVLEFGKAQPFAASQIAFVEQALEPIAISFYTAQNREHVQALLDKTRRQTEELSIREEELRTINEQLQIQADMQRAS